MEALIRLELRKQSKSFVGLLFIIAISLTLVTLSTAIIGNLTKAVSFLFVLVVLQAIGIPFFALLLGASAGASLRASGRNAEEDIPVRPSKRLFAAYIVSLTYLILLVTILFAVSTPLRYSTSLQEEFRVPIVMVIVLPLHSAAFVFSYWLSQALLGGIVSTIIVCVPVFSFFLTNEFTLQILNLFVAVMFFPCLVATFIHLSLMSWLMNRIERQRRIWIPIKVTIGLILVCAFLLSVGGMFLLGIAYDEASYHSRSCNCLEMSKE